MNWRHLTAVVWLRWRLAVNQWHRSGPLHAALMVLLAMIVLGGALPLFLGSLGAGLALFPAATPLQLLYTWDGLVAVFLGFWIVGLLTDLQRGDALSVTTFLHLPMSVAGAFFVNYLGSVVRLSTLLFVPAMLGLALALAFTRGPWGSAALPLTAAFLLLVTAATSQFRGWMELLMRDPRRRRTVVAMLSVAVVLVAQAPALVNLVPGGSGAGRRLEDAVLWGHVLLPVGWLPLGIKAAAERDAGRLLLATAGMTALGLASLWRAYRTTLGLCRGQATARGRGAAAAPAAAGPSRPSFLEARIPGVPDPAAAVAVAGLRSLLRAPEAKMMLVAPVAMCALSVAWATRLGSRTAATDRLLFGVMAIVVSLFGGAGLVGNQFGFDRDGFRTFVLSAVPRRDILLGKNLAAAPLPLGEFAILLAVVQVFAPLRWDHLLGLLPQAVVMYLLTCLLLNMLSILVPLRVDPHGVRQGIPVRAWFANLVAMLILFPLLQLLALGPVWAEALARWCGWLPGVPLFLTLALLQCGLVVPLYLRCLEAEGRLLQAREPRILDVVTGRAT